MPTNRRIDVKAILADEELRRKLMVSTIQATQAREGIDTTRDQADRAYYVVTEGERTAFFDLSKYQDQREKGITKHELFIRTLQGATEGVRVDVARRDFSFIEGSPLVYGNVSIVGPLFRDLPHLDPTYGRTRSGLNTTEIEQFVCERWEVSLSTKRQWVLFAKGGNYSRFYTDWDLVFDWTNDGYEFKEVVAQKYGSASRFVKSEDDYFSEGITWTQTTVLGINARILPSKGIFGVASPTLFLHRQVDRGLILAIMNSEVFDMLARCVARRNWGATAIGSLPVPLVGEQSRIILESRAETIFQRKAFWDESNEICARFTKAWILQEDIVEAVSSIPDRLNQLVAYEAAEDTHIQKLYAELNDEVYHIYGLPGNIRQMVQQFPVSRMVYPAYSPLMPPT